MNNFSVVVLSMVAVYMLLFYTAVYLGGLEEMKLFLNSTVTFLMSFGAVVDHLSTVVDHLSMSFGTVVDRLLGSLAQNIVVLIAGISSSTSLLAFSVTSVTITTILGLIFDRSMVYKISHDLFVPVSEAASASVLQCQCPNGFGRYASQNCTLCPFGSFSVTSSNAECTLCPSNKTTVWTGSKNQTECVCIPGHGIQDFFPSSPCTPCPDSSFAPGFKNEPCTACGWGALSLTGIESDSCQCNTRMGLFIQ
jgi:hypothetical protein